MDYIKREDVNRILYDLGVSEVYKLPSFWCHGGKDYQVIPTKYHNGYQQALADADEHIKGIPAADVVERKVGKWEKYGEDMQVCSACHKYWIWATDRYDFKYCPNCGARMEG